MATYVALLRGVNVGGNMLKMERLRKLCAELGHCDIQTYVQSGNVVFTCVLRADAVVDPSRLVALAQRAAPWPHLGGGVLKFLCNHQQFARAPDHGCERRPEIATRLTGFDKGSLGFSKTRRKVLPLGL